MSNGRRRGIGAAVTAAVGAGLVVVALAPGATAAPELPPVSPEDLVTSVITARPGPLNGTVEIENRLGLPALPGAPQLGNGTSTARVWSGDEGRARVSLPSPDGERTMVTDGTTRWTYDAAERSAIRVDDDGDDGDTPGRGGPLSADPGTDPAGAAATLIATLRESSTVDVDGTAEIAGRPAYQLVLTPAPTERTLLREVRVAVDAESRLPLQLSVLSTGAPEPALQVGFTEITYGPQDPGLFAFTPPPGTEVTDGGATGDRDGPRARPGPSGPGSAGGVTPSVVGDGWDAVVVAARPEPPQSPESGPEDPRGENDLSRLGTPVSGPWGSGRLISTAVASAIVTDDGRIAAGAVPEPVLTEALTR